MPGRQWGIYPSAPTLHWLRPILGDFLLCFLAAPTDCRSLSHWRGLETDSWKVPRGTTERALPALEESVLPLHSPFLLLKVEIMTRAAERHTHPHSKLNTGADEAWFGLGYFDCLSQEDIVEPRVQGQAGCDAGCQRQELWKQLFSGGRSCAAGTQ